MTTTQRLHALVCCCFAALFLQGCNTTPLRTYRDAPTPDAPSGVESNPYLHLNYAFTTIEFDDMGELWSREQLANTVNLLEQIKTSGYESVLEKARILKTSKNPEPQPVILLVFVHGWNHNASEESENFYNFHRFVKEYGEILPTLYPSDQRPALVATYIGWRGALYDTRPRYPNSIPPNFVSNALRFYNRKNAAERVAGPAATETILSLAAAAKTDLSSTAIAESRVVMIGHSLGALVMERAVSQAVLGGLLIDRAEDRRRQHVAETCHTSLNDLKREQSRLAAKLEELNRTASLVPEGAPTNWLELELESCTNSHSMVAAEIKAAQSLLSSLDEITAKERGRLGTNFQIAFNAVTNLNAKAKTNIWTEDSQLLRTWRASYRIAGFKGELEPEEESAGASTKAVQRSLLERQGSLPPQARTEFTTATNALAQLEASTARAFELLKQINQAQAEPSRKLAQLRKETNLDSCIAEKEAAWRTHTNILAQRGELQKLQSRIDGTNAVLSGIAPINTARAADLIILANPASEAVTARKMISSFESNKYLTNVTQARPVVISVSSDADRVTKDIFNRAMQLHSLNKNFRDTPQRTESTRAAPHVPRLRSHRIEQLTNRTAHVEYYSQTALAHMLKANLTPPGTNEFKRFEFLSTTDDYTSASTNGFAINSFRLDRTGENRSGYWVVQAPPELIRGHNDIFSPKFFGLVSGLFKASGVLEPRPTPTTASSAPAGPPNPAATTPATVSLENKYAPSL